ncbi:MAG TPA: SRPBCC family protein [Actinomycetes bacterium]|nr:SRPBCC family protein [Actinomycetes bacterium]
MAGLIERTLRGRVHELVLAPAPLRELSSWATELRRGWEWNVHQWDARVGGAIHVSLTFDSGPFEVKGEFLVVEPPRRLRYRWSGNQVVDVTIEAHGVGSRLRLEHSGLATDEECAITDAGWTSALEQLERLR